MFGPRIIHALNEWRDPDLPVAFVEHNQVIIIQYKDQIIGLIQWSGRVLIVSVPDNEIGQVIGLYLRRTLSAFVNNTAIRVNRYALT